MKEVTDWETCVKKHFPKREIPRNKKARAKLHREVDPVLLEDPEFQALAKEFHTKISLTQVQALIQALIMYAHQLLQVGESAEEVFAKLFAKQQVFATS